MPAPVRGHRLPPSPPQTRKITALRHRLPQQARQGLSLGATKVASRQSALHLLHPRGSGPSIRAGSTVPSAPRHPVTDGDCGTRGVTARKKQTNKQKIEEEADDFVRQYPRDSWGGSKSLHAGSKQSKERSKKLKQPSYTQVSRLCGQMKQGRIKTSSCQPWNGSQAYAGRESRGWVSHSSVLCCS